MPDFTITWGQALRFRAEGTPVYVAFIEDDDYYFLELDKVMQHTGVEVRRF